MYMDDCYIINRLYAGDYLNGNNIGHEIINLLSDDSGDNYIYVNQFGTINPAYNNKVKGAILVRMTDSIHRLEVLGVAKIGPHSQISYKSNKLTRPERLEEQNKIIDQYLAEHPVSYGGVSQSELFAKNKYRGVYENNRLITFKAEKLLLPYLDEDKKVYLADKKCQTEANYRLSDMIFSSQSLKQYVTKETHPEAYKEIIKLINDDSLWDKTRKPEKLDNIENTLKDGDTFNYLDIIGKQDDENVFSNLISYFISNDKNLLHDFCAEVLGVPDISETASVEREKSANRSRIDIYIEDTHHAIVIENKIKSEVNSVNERHNFTGDLIKSQLEDYYDYIEKYAESRDKKYFILMPNYHKIDLSKYKYSEKYQKLSYSKILNFFSTHGYQNQDEKKYYDDFVKSLRRHAEEYYDDQYAIMKRRFIKRITECRKEKHE